MNSKTTTSVRPIILAPKTRLAAELIRLLPLQDHTWAAPLLVARSINEQTELSARYPQAEVRQLEQLPAAVEASDIPSAVIFCCALGPLHPRQPREPSVDFSTVPRDLQGLFSVVNALHSRRVDIIYVSSVLAISSGPDRFYYSGWKRVIESAIGLALEQHPQAHWMAIYSGRLVPEKSIRSPSSLLATSYAQLAKRMLSQKDNRTARCIVGYDARMLLMQRALATAWSSLSGRVV